MNSVLNFAQWTRVFENEEEIRQILPNEIKEAIDGLNRTGFGPVKIKSSVKFSIPLYWLMVTETSDRTFEWFKEACQSTESYIYDPMYSKGKLHYFLFKEDMRDAMLAYYKRCNEDYVNPLSLEGKIKSPDIYVGQEALLKTWEIAKTRFSGGDDIEGQSHTNQIMEKRSDIKVFLDDDRQPLECVKLMKNRLNDTSLYADPDWLVIRTYGDFKRFLEKYGVPRLISFDHDIAPPIEKRAEVPIEDWFDLGENREWNGVDCLNLLKDYCLGNNENLPEFLIHTQNPTGYRNLLNDLNRFKRYQNENK